MAHGPAMTRNAAPVPNRPVLLDTPAFDATEFAELSEAIGDDGVLEMVAIFETETRHRLLRLVSGDQDVATQLREMHTLKGAAGTVAAPRLSALGEMFERAARRGIAVDPDQIGPIASALEAYLTEMRAWNKRRGASA